jgi:phage repressor protein C with HTH and peptisase S24 domain
MQQAITKAVIDSRVRFPHSAPMLSHDEIREELIRQIDERLIKQVCVARKLGVAPARISEIRRGLRKIQPDEMPVLAEMFGMTEAATKTPQRVEATDHVPHWGKVAQGVWLEQTLSDDEESFVPYDRLKGDPPPVDLFAVTPEGSSMNKVFPLGTQLICRRVPFGFGSFAAGDYVIVQRTAHDLAELTCKRVEIDAEGVYWLHSASHDPRYKEPWRIGSPDESHFADDGIAVIGKVVRAVQDFERVRH